MKLFNLLLLFSFFASNKSYGDEVAPSVMSFKTKISTAEGQPLEAASVTFRFTILDTAGTCVLYVEEYSNVSMKNSKGVVSFTLGSGNKTYPNTAISLHEVFNNSINSLSCQAGGTVSLKSTDKRKVVMQFNDGKPWQTLPEIAALGR